VKRINLVNMQRTFIKDVCTHGKGLSQQQTRVKRGFDGMQTSTFDEGLPTVEYTKECTVVGHYGVK